MTNNKDVTLEEATQSFFLVLAVISLGSCCHSVRKITYPPEENWWDGFMIRLCFSLFRPSVSHHSPVWFHLIQVLQRHRSSAGARVSGRGHSLRHLRGGGESLKHGLEDGLKRTTRCCSRPSPLTPASRFGHLPLSKSQAERTGWFSLDFMHNACF